LRTQTTLLNTNVLTTLIVNGEPNNIAAKTLAEALRALDYADAIVATALNGEFVPARKREATPVRDGDRIEIVAPRQGG
jgi:sulfur carrier protein